MKKLLLFLCSLMLLGAGTASALSYSYTDTSTKAGFDIEYNLNITGGPSSYNAVFTVNSSSTASDDWYAGAFNFKFFEGSVDTSLVLGPYSGSTGGWLVADKDTNSGASIDGWSSLTNAGRAGFFVDNLENSLTLPDIARGVRVSGSSPPSATFNFSISGSDALRELEIPFQVAYWKDGYAGRSMNIQFGQLSEELSIHEPATMFLIGTGFLGLAAVGRKRLLKR